MIDIRCLASGSRGNSYAIDDGETVLLLEAGITAKKIQRGFIDLLPRVAGCLVTHEHLDHAVGATALASYGIDIYASKGTLSALNKPDISHRLNILASGQQVKIGSWIVKAFDTEHDTAEPLGFLLYSTITKDKVLFATDTYYIKYRFSGLTVLMIECNYSLPILLQNSNTNKIADIQKNRLLKSHLSLENLKKYLQATDLKSVDNIYLLHLSERNGSLEFAEEIEILTGIPTNILKGGMR